MDSLGDRMKFYEKNGLPEKLLPLVPVVARLDGRSFHNFTKGLNRPFDESFSRLMDHVTEYLVHEFNAKIGYTQSDEITLIFLQDKWQSEILFSGKIQKIISILSACTTVIFNRELKNYLPSKQDKIALFDCRVFNTPTKGEAVNCLIWREQDATRNSIQMAARSVFSHNICQNKSCDQLQEMLFTQANINWNDYPARFKRGQYFQNRQVVQKFTPEQLEELPKQHEARKNPDLEFTRRETVCLQQMPILSQVTNQEECVFSGKDPLTA